MIQYDILNGDTTLIKERRKKVIKRTNTGELKKNKIPVAVTPTKSPVYMTIEKKVTLKAHQVVNTTSFKRENATQDENSRANIKANDGQFNGYMSENTARYVKRITENWLTAIELNQDGKKEDYRNKVYVTFLTLTLPCKQVHHDNYIKNRCLDPFIEWLRDDETPNTSKRKAGAGVEAYLWRAESQKNGNLHFHIICDKWIDHEKVRKKWNQILERLQYVTMYRMTQNHIYRNGFVMRQEQAEKQIEALMYVVQSAIKDGKKIPDTKYKEFPQVRNVLNHIISAYHLMPKKGQDEAINYGLDVETARMLVYKMQVKAYENGLANDWDNPNTTDIHKLNNINSVSAYITKYVSKSDVKAPKLKPNQRIMKSGLTSYIYTLKEGGDWENANDWEDETKWQPFFESRKVQGKIWGKSRNLSDGEKGKRIEPLSFTTEIKVLYTDEKVGRTSSTIRQNQVIDEYVQYIKKRIPIQEQQRIADIIQSDYCEVIPLGRYETKVNHKSKKKQKYFKIGKQLNFLDEFSKLIKLRYIAHYQKIFENIYGKVA